LARSALVTLVTTTLDRLAREFVAAVDGVFSGDIGTPMFDGLPDRLRSGSPTVGADIRNQPIVDRWLAPAVEASSGPWFELAEALLIAATELDWIVSYEHLDGSPVVDAFRPNYSFAAVMGPRFRGRTPPFHAEDLLAGFSLQAPHVTYPAHHHEPPELYGVMSGSLDWQIGETWHTKSPGDLAIHRSHESHSMRTTVEPVLTWVCWTRDPGCHVYMPSVDPVDETMAPIDY
jgi:mannose-6-phosphate isomerase-like protein (cupin superfamily)